MDQLVAAFTCRLGVAALSCTPHSFALLDVTVIGDRLMAFLEA